MKYFVGEKSKLGMHWIQPLGRRLTELQETFEGIQDAPRKDEKEGEQEAMYSMMKKGVMAD